MGSEIVRIPPYSPPASRAQYWARIFYGEAHDGDSVVGMSKYDRLKPTAQRRYMRIARRFLYELHRVRLDIAAKAAESASLDANALPAELAKKLVAAVEHKEETTITR